MHFRLCFLPGSVPPPWEVDFQQRNGAGTWTKLTPPEFDPPAFARQRFIQVQTPTPSVPTAEAFQSFPPCWDSPATTTSQTLTVAFPSETGSNTVPLLYGNTYFHEICRNLTAWRLLSHLVEIGQPVQKLLAGRRGRKADRQRDCIRLVSIGNQAKRHGSV